MKNETSQLNVVFFGTPDFVVPVLETLIKHFDVVGVVTTPDTLTGRKKILTPTPVKKSYQQFLEQSNTHGIIFDSPKFSDETIGKLQNLKPDIFVVAAYGHIIPKSVLDIPTYGSLNIHPSLLPKYRGPSPIQTALLNGDEKTGVTIIEMDEEIDHGPIIATKEITLLPTDTFASLHEKLFGIASEMLLEVINGYAARTLVPTPQQHDKATYCDHITKKDGFFDIENPPDKAHVDRMIRAYYPWPTAWTRIVMKNQESKIMKFLPEKKIQLEGGKPMSLKDFLNGYPELKEKIVPLFGED